MENYQQWRDEKAKELKQIPNHDERKKAWENYKSEDVAFLSKHLEKDVTEEFDTLENKNSDLFSKLDSSLRIINDIVSSEHTPDISKKDVDVLFFSFSQALGKEFSASGLSEIWEKSLQIAYKYWSDRLRDLLDNNVTNDEFYDELSLVDTHYLSKANMNAMSASSDKFRHIIEKYLKHREYIQVIKRHVYDDPSIREDYIAHVKELVSELIQDPLLQIDVNVELGNLKKMLEEIKSKIDSKVSVKT